MVRPLLTLNLIVVHLSANLLNSPFYFLSGTQAPAFEPRGRTMNPPEENKSGRGRDGSSDEASLTREKNRSTGLKSYTVTDGEFTSFPEIQATTAQQLMARGIQSLFPIQQHSFYPVYNREDVIARDLTGSGKTLAFCLPVTEYLRKNNLLGSRKIQAIMLCPTRELAIQVSLIQPKICFNICER